VPCEEENRSHCSCCRASRKVVIASESIAMPAVVRHRWQEDFEAARSWVGGGRETDVAEADID